MGFFGRDVEASEASEETLADARGRELRTAARRARLGGGRTAAADPLAEPVSSNAAPEWISTAPSRLEPPDAPRSLPPSATTTIGRCRLPRGRLLAGVWRRDGSTLMSTFEPPSSVFRWPGASGDLIASAQRCTPAWPSSPRRVVTGMPCSTRPPPIRVRDGDASAHPPGTGSRRRASRGPKPSAADARRHRKPCRASRPAQAAGLAQPNPNHAQPSSSSRTPHGPVLHVAVISAVTSARRGRSTMAHPGDERHALALRGHRRIARVLARAAVPWSRRGTRSSVHRDVRRRRLAGGFTTDRMPSGPPPRRGTPRAASPSRGPSCSAAPSAWPSPRAR